jgi:hypothetical protein
MIAHAGGLPLEETLVQLAPMVSGAALALGLLLRRVRSWVHSLDPSQRRKPQPAVRCRRGRGVVMRPQGHGFRSPALGALALVPLALVWSAVASVRRQQRCDDHRLLL